MSTGSGPQALNPTLSERAVENAKRREATMQQIVALYLKEKKHVEEKVKGDLQAYASLVLNDFDQFCTLQTVGITHSLGDNKPERYVESYVRVKEWIHQSLDLYKPELLGFLYPIFMSIFIHLVHKEHRDEAKEFLKKYREDHEPMFTEEIDRVESISTPQHILENPVSALFFRDKYILKENDLMLILRIMNKTLQIETLKSQDESNAFVRKSGFVAAAKGHVVRWPKTPEEIVAAKYEMVADSSGTLQPQKKQRTAAPPELPEQSIPLPKLDESVEVAMLEDLARRVEVSAISKPSICFHTLANSRSSMNCATINGDGSMIAAGFEDSLVKLWDLSEGDSVDSASAAGASVHDRTPSSVLIGHGGPVYSTAFSPDNRFLVSSSEDATLRLWSLETRSNLVCFKGHSYPVWSVAFSPFGIYFASASHDRTARLWSTDHISFLRLFVGHYSDVDCVCFHPNSNYLATGSTDQTLRLWDIQSGHCIRVFSGNTGAISACEISPCGKFLASATDKGQVTLWDLGSCKVVGEVGHHAPNTPVYSLSFANGKTNVLASGGADCSIRLWDVSAAVANQDTLPSQTDFGCGIFRTKDTPVSSLRFTRANLLVAAGAYGGKPNAPRPPQKLENQ